MARPLSGCFRNFTFGARATRLSNQSLRQFSLSRSRSAASPVDQSSSSSAAARGTFTDFSQLFPEASRANTGALNTIFPQRSRTPLDDETGPASMYHFHVYAHKHNTHITLTRPNREPMISLSCGNLGFKSSNRGKFEPAYQLAAYVLGQINNRGWLAEIKDVELILRGFGEGRSAATKALMGTEGRFFRDRICRVTDGTRLKHGGTRSKPPRSL